MIIFYPRSFALRFVPVKNLSLNRSQQREQIRGCKSLFPLYISCSISLFAAEGRAG